MFDSLWSKKSFIVTLLTTDSKVLEEFLDKENVTHICKTNKKTNTDSQRYTNRYRHTQSSFTFVNRLFLYSTYGLKPLILTTSWSKTVVFSSMLLLAFFCSISLILSSSSPPGRRSLLETSADQHHLSLPTYDDAVSGPPPGCSTTHQCCTSPVA